MPEPVPVKNTPVMELIRSIGDFQGHRALQMNKDLNARYNFMKIKNNKEEE